MDNPKVIGATGAPAIPLERQAEIIGCEEVYHEVIEKSKMFSLQYSLHAPAIVRKAARDARLVTTSTSTKLEVNTSTEINARSITKLSISDMPIQVDKLVEEIEKGAASRDTALRNADVAGQDKDSAFADAINFHAKPYVPAPGKAAAKAKEPSLSGLHRTLDAAASLRRYMADTDEAKDADNDSNADSKATEKPESTGDDKSTTSPKPRRGVVAPGDFMKQVRKLQEQKRLAPKVVPAGPPRRIVFGNLPEWADIPSILHLVYGGAIERAWSENGEVIVQFVDQEKCVEYYEAHSDGIKLKDGDEDVTISVAMPEDGLPDNAKLCTRVEEGASRVVSLSGLPTSIKASDSEDDIILGVISDPTWGSKKLDHIVIKQAEVGVDVYVFFYDLHDGWEFLQSIKEGTYDCVAKFEVDPCAASQGFHFVDEPNPMFSAILGAAE